MSIARAVALTLLFCAAAAALGVWAGALYVRTHPGQPPGLHEILHQRLHLTPDQDRRIEGLERGHAARRTALQAEMRSANADLARAYLEAHDYTPKVQAAIDRFHRAMAALQTETMRHVFAMRSVLRPDQTRRFDATVVTSLTAKGS